MKKLQEKIQNIDSSNITESDIAVIESTIQELDNGTIRLASYQDGEWAINEWVRDAILLFFSVRNLKEINANDLLYYDKLEPKRIIRNWVLELSPRE